MVDITREIGEVASRVTPQQGVADTSLATAISGVAEGVATVAPVIERKGDEAVIREQMTAFDEALSGQDLDPADQEAVDMQAKAFESADALAAQRGRTTGRLTRARTLTSELISRRPSVARQLRANLAAFEGNPALAAEVEAAQFQEGQLKDMQAIVESKAPHLVALATPENIGDIVTNIAAHEAEFNRQVTLANEAPATAIQTKIGKDYGLQLAQAFPQGIDVGLLSVDSSARDAFNTLTAQFKLDKQMEISSRTDLTQEEKKIAFANIDNQIQTVTDLMSTSSEQLQNQLKIASSKDMQKFREIAPTLAFTRNTLGDQTTSVILSTSAQAQASRLPALQQEVANVLSPQFSGPNATENAVNNFNNIVQSGSAAGRNPDEKASFYSNTTALNNTVLRDIKDLSTYGASAEIMNNQVLADRNEADIANAASNQTERYRQNMQSLNNQAPDAGRQLAESTQRLNQIALENELRFNPLVAEGFAAIQWDPLQGQFFVAATDPTDTVQERDVSPTEETARRFTGADPIGLGVRGIGAVLDRFQPTRQEFVDRVAKLNNYVRNINLSKRLMGEGEGFDVRALRTEEQERKAINEAIDELNIQDIPEETNTTAN